MSKSTCPCEQINASATAEGSAITISGDIVTANASATASSAVSYADALSIATKDAQQLANNYAQHDADVIGQTLTIVNSRSLIPSNTSLTVGSNTSPYSQVYTANGVILSSNSPGNQVILTSSKNKLYVNGAQVYTSADPQSDASANTFYGTDAGLDTTGINNSGFGYDALANNTTGGDNTAIGSNSLQANTEGSSNTAIGRYSLQKNTTGSSNTASGSYSLQANTTVGNNTAIGVYSLQTNTTGSNNTAIGGASLRYNTTGNDNTAVGAQALISNTTGSQNTASGSLSLDLNKTGSQNTASGWLSLYSNTTGTYNTAFGNAAGVPSGSNFTNCTAFGNNAVCNASNQIVLGNGVTALRCNVQTITSSSDLRDKKDVEDLESSLEFIEQLKPVRFNWNMRDGGKVDVPEIGFIAQDLQQVQQDTGMKIPNLVYDVNPEKLEASYGALLPLLVKSIQELSQDNKKINATNLEMDVKIQELTAIIQEMKQ